MTPSIRDLYKTFAEAITPPPLLNLAEWSEQNIKLSPEDSATQGDFIAWPFQREPLEVMSPGHPCEKVVLLCASQTMKTRLMLNLLGYIIAVDPGPTLLVEPTQKDAKDVSVDRVSPMIRDTAVLKEKVADFKSRDSSNTLDHKKFPGGHVTFAFATSPSALASRPIRYLLLDEVSRYDASAGKEGDPVRLAEKRTTTFWNRKIILASSPGNDGNCRITKAFEYSDQRDWFVRCPYCDFEQVLLWEGIVWSKNGEKVKAKRMEGDDFIPYETLIEPTDARYRCSHCDCLIENRQKYMMIEKGRWISQNLAGRYPGFRINAFNSMVRTWGDIVLEFIECEKDPEQMRVFTNTVLAQTWKELAEEPPDAEKLWLRAQNVPIPDPLPAEVLFLTAGVDVQGDRLECQIRGWGRGKQSWLVDYGVFSGRYTESAVWSLLDEFLDRKFQHVYGLYLPIMRVAIDSGFGTQDVYAWARRKDQNLVIITKGIDSGVSLLGHPRTIDAQKKRVSARSVRVWPVNASMMKAELYGWLNQPLPEEGQPFPKGFLHDYDQGREYFEQLCAERLEYKLVNGFRKGSWKKIRDRNEALDTFGECRAAAEHVGISRFTDRDWDTLESYLRPDVPVENLVLREQEKSPASQIPTERIASPRNLQQRRSVRGRFSI